MITMEQLRSWTETSAQEISDDNLRLVEQTAIGLIQDATSNYFGPLEEYTEYIDSPRDRYIWLSYDAVKPDVDTPEVSSIRYRSIQNYKPGLDPIIDWFPAIAATSWATVNYSTECLLQHKRRLMRVSAIWPYPGYQIEVKYHRGYEVDTDNGSLIGIPSQLIGLILEVVGLILTTKGNEGIQTFQVETRGASVKYESDLAKLPSWNKVTQYFDLAPALF